MTTAQEIIESCGGINEVAYRCSVTYHRVYCWAKDNFIPEKQWAKIIRLSGDTVSLEELHRINELHRRRICRATGE